jgi:N-acyl-D-aspartate/D-glutamate deacylase
MDFDLLLRDGVVFDGTGAPGERGSVGVRAGRIEAVGDLEGAQGREVIECAGRAIAPGFIDMHSHSDFVLPQAEHGAVLAPLVEQGITTIVGGNCGFSPAPCTERNRALIALSPLFDRPFEPRWGGMGEFFAALEAQGLALNFAEFVGHGTLRAAVKGLDPSPASADETAAMADLARAALDQGAIGISTGLGYAPGVFASLDELVAVTTPLAERGGVYASHARSYFALPQRGDAEALPSNLAALDETAAIGRAHGVPAQHSHLIFVGDASWPTTDRALERLERHVAGGVDLACDAFPYVGGNTTLAVFMPPWALSDLRGSLGDPERRARAAATLDRVLPSLGMRWSDTQILWVPSREQARYQGLTVDDIARERGANATETYLDLVLELGPRARILNWNYSGRGEEETSLRKVLAHPLTCFETDTILTGEGFDNPASFGTFPRILGRYVRELGLFSLPEAIRRMTALSARRMGLADRGRVARGLAADLVVFDPATVGDAATPRAPNLPPQGIGTVVVNGRVVVRQGRFDPASRAGRVLRRAA